MTELVTTIPEPNPSRSVSFTIDPVGSTITFVVGADTYVSDADAVPINTELTFTAVDDVEDPIRYEWDFGDGTIAHGPEVLHTYTIPNPHLRAYLKVTDAFNREHLCWQQIYLEDDSGSPPTVVRF